MKNPQHSLIERAIGELIGIVIYNELKDTFRAYEVKFRIQRHVKMANKVKEEIENEDC